MYFVRFLTIQTRESYCDHVKNHKSRETDDGRKNQQTCKQQDGNQAPMRQVHARHYEKQGGEHYINIFHLRDLYNTAYSRRGDASVPGRDTKAMLGRSARAGPRMVRARSLLGVPLRQQSTTTSYTTRYPLDTLEPHLPDTWAALYAENRLLSNLITGVLGACAVQSMVSKKVGHDTHHDTHHHALISTPSAPPEAGATSPAHRDFAAAAVAADADDADDADAAPASTADASPTSTATAAPGSPPSLPTPTPASPTPTLAGRIIRNSGASLEAFSDASGILCVDRLESTEAQAFQCPLIPVLTPPP